MPRPALFRVPDCDLVARWVGGGEHAALVINPFHGVSLGGEGGGYVGRVIDVDAEADIARPVAAPELHSAVTEPDHARTVVVWTAAEELVKRKGCFRIGHVESHIGEHSGF